MNAPKISVVIPMKDADKYCAQAITSILDQDYQNFELIICDDGSSDSSYEIAKRLTANDSRVQLIQNQTSIGISETLKRTFALCTGEYIARMDADDISLPTRLSEQYRYFQNNSRVVALGSCGDIISEDGTVICPFMKSEECEGMLAHEMPIISPTLMFKRKTLDLITLPGQEFDGIEDIILIKRFQSIGTVRNVQSKLIKYRITPNALSNIPRTQRRERHQIITRAVNNGILSKEDSLRLAKIKEMRKGPNSDRIYKERLIQLALKNSTDRQYVRNLIKSEISSGRISIKIIMYRILLEFNPTIYK